MSRPSKGELFVEKLTANENIAIGIIFNANTGGSNIIRGFVTDDTLSFGTRANYQDLLDMNMADAAEALTSGGVGAVLGSTLGGLAGKATKFAARATGLGGAKFVQQTILSWEGSERPLKNMKFLISLVRPLKWCFPASVGLWNEGMTNKVTVDEESQKLFSVI
jgi:hypothetical protein